MNILDYHAQTHKPEGRSSHRGPSFAGPCPGCGGDDRFVIWPEQNDGLGTYYCRGCAAGGDAIKYLMTYHGHTFKQAAAMTGKNLDKTGQPSSRPLRPLAPATPAPSLEPETSRNESSELWQAHAQKWVEGCQQHLRAYEKAQAWLIGRGLHAATIEKFRLGYNPEDPGYRPRKSWGLPDIQRDGKIIRNIWLPRGVTIPTMLPDTDRLARIRIRQPVDKPKYYVVPGGDTDPLPLLAIKGSWSGKHRYLVVVESELDALLLHQEAGDLVDVLALGSSSAKPRHQAAWNLVQSARWIGMALDWDDAGHKATAFWLQNFPQQEPMDIRNPEYKDVGEMTARHQSVRHWLLKHLPPVLTLAAKPGPPPGTPGPVIELHQLLAAQPVPVWIDLQTFQVVERCNGELLPYLNPPDKDSLQRIYDLMLGDAVVERYLVGREESLIGVNQLFQTR